MAAPTLLPNLMAGNKGASDLALANIGLQPIGNGAGSKLPGPSSIGGNPSPVPVSNPTQFNLNPASTPPALPPGVTGSPVNNPHLALPIFSPGSGILAMDSGGASPSSLLPTNAVNPTTAYPTPTDSSSAPSLGFNDANVSKQMTDEYGKGVGGVISSLINTLGSSDDAYMQAYEKAMAQPNAEAMATLSTNLGNEGVSGDSSTAAIAKADLLSGEVADEGLQAQQLKQNDLAELLGLVQPLESTANKAVNDTGWSEFGRILGDVGGAIATAI